MNKNGRAELYVNNVKVLDTPIRWTKDHSKRFANQLLFSNYRSGAGSESSEIANIWFDDFSLVSSVPTYEPTWCDNLYSLDNLYDAISNTNYHLTTIDNSVSFSLKNGLQGILVVKQGLISQDVWIVVLPLTLLWELVTHPRERDIR